MYFDDCGCYKTTQRKLKSIEDQSKVICMGEGATCSCKQPYCTHHCIIFSPKKIILQYAFIENKTLVFIINYEILNTLLLKL